MQHLLHNAIKFNRVRGRITIETGLTAADAFVSLRDTGVGISEQRLSNLWDGFSPLLGGPGSTERRLEQAAALIRANTPERLPLPGATGRGLPLVHYIVAAHGGRVEATSRYGYGSEFTVYLPLDFALNAEVDLPAAI
jgi:signal transduction histidine kinase